MTIDLRGVSFHLVEDVDLIRTTEKHLFIDQRQREIRSQKHYHQSADKGTAYGREGAGLLSKDGGHG